MKIIFIKRFKSISNLVNAHNRIINNKNDTERPVIPFFASDMPTSRMRKRNQNK